MNSFIYSAFADEISPMLTEQMNHLDTLGIKYIEARGIDGKNISDITLEEAKEIKKRLDERGFRISALGSPIGKIKITDEFEPERAKLRHTIELAKILGTDIIRIFSFYIPDDDPPEKWRDEVLKRMSAFLDEVQGTGIRLFHENERGIYGDSAERCFDILSSLSSDNLSATFDPANFVLCGVDIKAAIKLLLPYVKYLHIKDANRKTGKILPAGYGDGDVEYMLNILNANNYKGFASIEPHLTNFSGHDALELNIIKLNAGNNKENFTLAYEALKTIIDRLPAR